jgi:hypothetical protein
LRLLIAKEESLSKISFDHVEEYLEVLEKLQLLRVRDDLKEELEMVRTSLLGVGEMTRSVTSISPFRTISVAGAANEAGGGIVCY